MKMAMLFFPQPNFGALFSPLPQHNMVVPLDSSCLLVSHDTSIITPALKPSPVYPLKDRNVGQDGQGPGRSQRVLKGENNLTFFHNHSISESQMLPDIKYSGGFVS